MRISDWSSDVCSSDLFEAVQKAVAQRHAQRVDVSEDLLRRLDEMGDRRDFFFDGFVRDRRLCLGHTFMNEGRAAALRRRVVRKNKLAVVLDRTALCRQRDRKSTRLNSSH